MKLTLMEYQAEAVRAVLSQLDAAGDLWRVHGKPSAFALSSTTGSGKTVIAAAVIESLMYGSDEYGVEADPGTVVLWVSKDPALNAQTCKRFDEYADLIRDRMVVLDKDFAGESLAGSTVYFINPDKLRTGAGFVTESEARHTTFWQILANTIADGDKTLYMVLDEAHEGMRAPAKGDQTIVQRIINGGEGHPPVPIVWGISATAQRFDDAMKKVAGRTTFENVVIDPKDVQESGLLKNTLVLDIPGESGDFETTMVREATLDFVDVCAQWDAYSRREGVSEERRPVPLLVVQVPNKEKGESTTAKGERDEDALIARVLKTVRDHWPQIPKDGIAHVIGSRGTITIGEYEIPHVAPEDVQDDERIRVLLAKDAVSTGWDCPRAEVLVSLRPGKDHTYITQLLGRMVRTPLAQATNVDRLNSASAYLPRFDAAKAQLVVEEIMGLRDPASGPATGVAVAKVLLRPVQVDWNPTVPEGVRGVLEALPSRSKPATAPRPIKRLLVAAQALAQDGLVPGANDHAHQAMFGILDDIREEYADLIELEGKEILTAEIRRFTGRRNVDVEETEHRRGSDEAVVADAMRTLRRMISDSVVTKYLGRCYDEAREQALEQGGDPDAVDMLDVEARIAALGQVRLPEGEGSVQSRLEERADAVVQDWLTAHGSAIDNLPDTRAAVYDKIRAMARTPEPAAVELTLPATVESVAADGKTPLPTAPRHVISDVNGDYPLDAKLNNWERAVIAHELANPDVVAWYRNPSSASKAALRIPYEYGDGWKSVQPDIIVFEKGATEGEYLPSIIDPHGSHLGDAGAKLAALASFADRYRDDFARVIAIGDEAGTGDEKWLIGIDLKQPEVRAAALAVKSGDTEAIRPIFKKHGTRYAAIPKGE